MLIIGSGLTSADVVATLYRRGHAGPVQIISRRGPQSQPHGPAQRETKASFPEPAEVTALGLLRRVRKALAEESAVGLTWHPVFDRLRAQGSGIWAAWPMGERRRFLRHLRGLWDAHRFRIAPQTHEILRRMEAARRLTYLTGRISGLWTGGASVVLTLRQGHGETVQDKTAQIIADHVVLATGPAHSLVTSDNPGLADLARQGLAQADSLGFGLATTRDGKADGQQAVTPDVFVSGPLARGMLGELMGVPEVTRWAEHIARCLSPNLRLNPG